MEGRHTVQTRHPTHPADFGDLDSTGLRARFLVDNLFGEGEVRLTYSHHDRLVIGGAVPAGRELALPVPAQLRAVHFTDRRELAVACLSGTGRVTVAGTAHELAALDVLYVGRGATDWDATGPDAATGQADAGIGFAGDDARFYLVSAPARQTHPTALGRRDEVFAATLGEQAHANVRTIRRYVHANGIASDQLILGITELAEGSVWNTTPCPTHERRTEVYLYFGLGDGERVVHLCGRPDATRSLIVANEQAVISPSWSVHTGAGTANYAFVWAMAGENVAYDDLDMVATEELR
jgi:4-deoxy-L-threo-5-hexosulose-uronate ketol-isomerase